ncbi:NADAP-like protein [Mya arenaria]|uniref:NADAP-like protein n=1 Tax=Mya arenaria TaxID=6604 RepID=A0ABY7E807_MYAAR|nr:kanadaptin-like [Mya arenaria]WAR04696.1 NADAP-like protein [Mya arenaria]
MSAVTDDTDENTKEEKPPTAPEFKAPTFRLPVKKKIKSSTEADKAFNPQPPAPVPENDDKSKIDAEQSETNSSDSTSETNKAPSAPKVDNKPALPPAERQHQSNHAAVPYTEPIWGSACKEKFSFEVIKNGAVIDNVDLTTQNFHVVGRLPSCDIPMEHPSLSRHHAVIQYSGGSADFAQGWYLYDLDSTHGTWINKNKVPPSTFHRLHVDYVLKFGGSTRLFILQGPDSDRQEESELSVKEMKEQRDKQQKEAEVLRQAEIDESERKAELNRQREEQKGCSWGIDENDPEEEEEEESAVNPFAELEAENEYLYINDPKKALNHYFEREGLELPEYEFHEAGYGKWKCTVELPIDGPNGEPVIAEVVVSGKKKEGVIACALEACRTLDRHGELRKSAQESRKRKGKNWEDDDFYDSDEDTFLDRTGAIEKKRELRKKKVGKSEQQTTETYDSLLEKHTSVAEEIQSIEAKLEQAKAQAAAMDSDDVDALDAYMSAIKSGMMDTKTKMKLKTQLMELKQQEQRLRKLVNLAKPATLPEVSVMKPDLKKSVLTAQVGKMKGPSAGKVVRKPVTSIAKKEQMLKESEDESEEEEEESMDIETSAVEKTNQVKETNKSAPKNASVKTPEAPKLIETINVNIKEKIPSVASASKKKGPSMPLSAVLEKLQEEADRAENSTGKRKSDSNRNLEGGKKLKGDNDYSTEDPDYAVWLPPENQSGDGKTHLNEKLGY